jgi:hypothetical protein
VKAPDGHESRALLQVAAHPGGLTFTRALELGIPGKTLEALEAKGLVTQRRAAFKIVKAARQFL